MSSTQRAPSTATSAPTAHIGCAGWALSAAVASHFPGDGTHLERYASVFSCVEINSSFYRPHHPKTYARWAAIVPGVFRFSVKLPRTITHTARLQGAERSLEAFLSQVGHLRDKLGYLLVQLPPSLLLDADKASRFFRVLRELTATPVALEPRHASWFGAEGAEVMRQAGVRCVLGHPAAQPEIDLAQIPLVYCRLHGAPRIYDSAYDEAFLDAVGERVRAAQAAGQGVWCIFDNTAAGAAVPNALWLRRALGLQDVTRAGETR